MATWKKVVVESASDTIAQDTTGNSATATALETSQDFSITGDITAPAVSFNGTGDVSLTATIDNNVVGADELDVSDNGTSGQILSSNGDGSFSWINASSGTLSGLSDTNISSVSSGDILLYDGSEWDNVAVSGDVSLSGTSFIVNSVQVDAVTLGTNTTGNYVATIAGTTNEIEVSGSGSETAAVTIGLPDDVTIGNNLTVTGDLTVNGSTTTVNTTNLLVDDTFIALNSGGSTNVDSGIVFEGAVNKVFGWDQSQESGRFGVDYAGGDASAVGGGFSPDAWVSTVHTAPGDSSSATAALGQIGNMYIDSSNQDIYIYS